MTVGPVYDLFDLFARNCGLIGHGKPAGVLCCDCANAYCEAMRGTGLDVTGKKLEVNCRRKPRNDEERRSLNK